jgi:hypothetical protein
MELGTSRAGKAPAMPEAARYTLDVRARGSPNNLKPWGWEFWRDGEPLPARLREEGFTSEHTTMAAGKVALRYFLEGLAQEERKP